CLSNKYVTNSSPLKWRCSNGHTWPATPANIRKGTWCPACAVGKRRISRKYGIGTLTDHAEKLGGECLSSEYTNPRFRYTWRCRNAHEWLTTWDSVRRGSWCQKCGAAIGVFSSVVQSPK